MKEVELVETAERRSIWWIPLATSMETNFWHDRTQIKERNLGFSRKNGDSHPEMIYCTNDCGEILTSKGEKVAEITHIVTESGGMVCQIELQPKFAQDTMIIEYFKKNNGTKIDQV